MALWEDLVGSLSDTVITLWNKESCRERARLYQNSISKWRVMEQCWRNIEHSWKKIYLESESHSNLEWIVEWQK